MHMHMPSSMLVVFPVVVHQFHSIFSPSPSTSTSTSTSTMSLSLLVCLLGILSLTHAVPPPTGFLIDCGASNQTHDGALLWIPDDGFIYTGTKATLPSPHPLRPTLSTLRHFTAAHKHCYTFPVIKGSRYLLRTTYFYGSFDNLTSPPVFDQIIDGTKWSTVNTTFAYSKGLSSYYEIIISASGKTLSLCLVRNKHTEPDRSPFINAIELEWLPDSLYNATDFSKYALSTIARHWFGGSEPVIKYPEDKFNRFWQPFTTSRYQEVRSKVEALETDFWNLPPNKVFENGLAAKEKDGIRLQWPALELPRASYYVALYFQDERSNGNWRVFDIVVNGKVFYKGLNVTTAGVNVFAAQWLLEGATQIELHPVAGSEVGPIINAAEMFQLLVLHGRTVTRDLIAMEDLARSLNNPPPDWRGDPCMPKENSWKGVTCSDGDHIRVVSLNLTGFGLSGKIPPSIANLTAIKSIWLGNNNLTGSLPDLKPLKELVSLHLENNNFGGNIPRSWGYLDNLQEIFLQNNNLKGSMPLSLTQKTGINLKITPGNHITRRA
ncbi:hypothetical protein AMTRI_Chr04g185370 [Amborella trichopoda]